jgi:low affinity Fe/Cu permease
MNRKIILFLLTLLLFCLQNPDKKAQDTKDAKQEVNEKLDEVIKNLETKKNNYYEIN